MRTEQELVVALGFDANYTQHAAATVASIARTTTAPLRFLLLHADVASEVKCRVEAAAPGAKVDWIAVREQDVPAFADRSHFTRATLFRLGLEKLAPRDCQRVIYLDCDLVVVSSLDPLWRADLSGRPIAAVVDENVDALEFGRRWGLVPGCRYFNAGVLLIDLDEVRRRELFSKAIRFLARHGTDLPWNDQDALNWACWGEWLELDPAWNIQRNMAISGRLGAPAIVHFTGSEKPWTPGAYHPWSWLYWRALGHTAFRGNTRSTTQRLRAWLRWQRRKPGRECEGPWLGPAWLDISLVICTRNRAAQLARCLEVVAKIQFEGAWEVVVVDNGSSDATASTIEAARKTMPAPLRTIREPVPGLGRARNAGIAAAGGRIVAFTDDDCYVAPDYLAQAVRAFDDPKVGFVTGRVNLFDASDAPVTVNPSPTPRRIRASSYLHTDYVIGANLAFRRGVLERIGGFAVDLGAGTPFAAEDVDAAARACHVGWEGAYDPNLVVAHHHGRKTADVPRLFKLYDIGRGAYTIRYLMRGQLVQFLQGVASVRFRMGPVTSWRAKTFSTPLWEAYGAAFYALTRAKHLGRRMFRKV